MSVFAVASGFLFLVSTHKHHVPLPTLDRVSVTTHEA